MTTPSDEIVEGMNKIDAAITELLTPLGEGWKVASVAGATLRFEQIGQAAYEVITGYKATITNGPLSAEGDGVTVGDAIAMAFVAVMKQALASHAYRR